MSSLLPLLPVTGLTALAVVGAIVGVVVALRRSGSEGTQRNREGGLLRLTAEVHTGWEQTLIGLLRELGLPRGSADVGYGQLYVEPQSEHRLLVRSRSEIGRGFVGAIEITPRRLHTDVSYAILRLPGDESLRNRVLGLELDLVGALQRVDRGVDLRLAATALREFDRPRTLLDGDQA